MQLWLTKDFGQTWTLVQESVKSFYWALGVPSTIDDIQEDLSRDYYGKGNSTNNIPTLFVERQEPSGTSTVLASSDLFKSFKIIARGVKDFHVKGDFMFCTRESKTTTMGGQEVSSAITLEKKSVFGKC